MTETLVASVDSDWLAQVTIQQTRQSAPEDERRASLAAGRLGRTPSASSDGGQSSPGEGVRNDG